MKNRGKVKKEVSKNLMSRKKCIAGKNHKRKE